jgi:transcription initiation factor TFIIH subunit 1
MPQAMLRMPRVVWLAQTHITPRPNIHSPFQPRPILLAHLAPGLRSKMLILEPLDPALLDQMRSCHTAATEFLRQYWAALLPLPTGALGPATAPKVKGGARDPDKAKKMADYLRSTERKIEAVVHTAGLISPDNGPTTAARVRAVSRVMLGLWVFLAETRSPHCLGACFGPLLVSNCPPSACVDLIHLDSHRRWHRPWGL